MAISQLKKIKQPQIGQLICDLRQEMGLTQEEFAVQCGVAFSTVNRWEKGLAQPSPMALKQLESKLKKMGSQGLDLLEKYYS
jgi:transcriptional regulator with XRE-family HTH domain